VCAVRLLARCQYNTRFGLTFNLETTPILIFIQTLSLIIVILPLWSPNTTSCVYKIHAIHQTASVGLPSPFQRKRRAERSTFISPTYLPTYLPIYLLSCIPQILGIVHLARLSHHRPTCGHLQMRISFSPSPFTATYALFSSYISLRCTYAASISCPGANIQPPIIVPYTPRAIVPLVLLLSFILIMTIAPVYSL
jgi:hypothetical protein